MKKVTKLSKKVYLIIGSPGVGKSWVCNQLGKQYKYIAHDDYKHLPTFRKVGRVLDAARTSDVPVVTETPFSIKEFKTPLEKNGMEVIPLFVVDKAEVVAQRYQQREGKPIPQQHLSRQETYQQRAKEMNAFVGTSTEVLSKLKGESNE